jgi:hypothetical protein
MICELLYTLQATDQIYDTGFPITEKTVLKILLTLRFSALVVASKENGLEVSAEKTEYCIWSCLETRMQDKITTLKVGRKSFERVEQFKCLGMTLRNQYSIHEEIKNGLKSKNACRHSVQNQGA